MHFFVKPPFFHDEGAMHFGRGKFILPVFAPGTSKEATEKGKKILTIVACVLVAVVLIVATVLGYQKKVAMPLRQELLESIGKPIADVAAQLEVPREEMQQIEPGLYCVPTACEYADVTFDVLLYFEENEHLLRSFGYTANYNADAELAAESIAAIAKVRFVDELTLSDGTVLEPKEEQLKTYLADHESITLYQTLDSSGGEAVSRYIDYLESTDYYEGKVGKYIKKNALYYEDLYVVYQANTQKVTINLWNVIEADRKIDY